MSIELKEVVFQSCLIGDENKEMAFFIFNDSDYDSWIRAPILAIPREEEYLVYQGELFSTSIGHIPESERILRVRKLFSNPENYPLLVIETERSSLFYLAKVIENELHTVFKFSHLRRLLLKGRKIGKKLSEKASIQNMYVFCLPSGEVRCTALFFLKEGKLMPINSGVLTLSYFDFIDKKKHAGERNQETTVVIKNISCTNRALKAEATIDGKPRSLVIDTEMLKHDGVVEFHDNEFYLNWAII